MKTVMDNTNTTIVMAKDLDDNWYNKMANELVARCNRIMKHWDKIIEDKYIEGLRYGIDEDGNHINLVSLSEKNVSQILEDMRNINNHRSRQTNIISQLPTIEFFSPFDEVMVKTI
jgi:hypothetical protein